MRTYTVPLVLFLWGWCLSYPALSQEIEYRRLSADPTTPLFYVVVIGNPIGDYIAFLSEMDNSCAVEVWSAENNEIVFSIQDHKNCSSNDDAEDGFAVLNATQFLPFLEANFDIVELALKQFGIEATSPPLPIIDKMAPGATAGYCAFLDQLRVCADTDIRVSKK